MSLAWVLSHPNTIVIPGASRVAHVTQNAEAAELTLTEDEVVRLADVAESLPLKGGIAVRWRHFAAEAASS